MIIDHNFHAMVMVEMGDPLHLCNSDDEHGDDENLAISSKVSPPSCRPARSNTICFQSEQKSETIFHENGKYQISHLPCFIKQDLGEGGHGLYFVFPWQVKIQ